MEGYLRERKVEVITAQDVDNVMTMMTLVGLGAGFALLPDYVAHLLFRNVATRPLKGGCALGGPCHGVGTAKTTRPSSRPFAHW